MTIRGHLSPERIQLLLSHYFLPSAAPPEGLYEQLGIYLELLLKWNARTNLTAIRDPEEIVTRHFGESLFAAQHLGDCESLLDFGSGAGFPGIPIQLLRPDLSVTLAESQNKKSTFLREVVRTLGLTAAVWAGRVEALPASETYDVVTLRAVDDMALAIETGAVRAKKRLLLLTTGGGIPPTLQNFSSASAVAIPGSAQRELVTLNRNTYL